MNIINIRVEDRLPKVVAVSATAVSDNAFRFVFEFDDTWDADALKTIWIVYGDGEYETYPITGNELEVMLGGWPYINIGASQGTKLASRPCKINIQNSIKQLVDEGVQMPSEDQWDTIIEMINQFPGALEAASRAEAAADESAANLEESKAVVSQVNTVGETQVKAVQNEGAVQTKAVGDAAEAKKTEIAGMDAVQFDVPQDDKTPAQKKQARTNIGAASQEDVDSISKAIVEQGDYVNHTSALVSGKTCDIYNSVGKTVAAPYGTAKAVSYAEISCAEGDMFEIKGKGAADNGFWTIVDADRVVLTKNEYAEISSVNTYNTPVRVVAPANAVKLLVCMENEYIGYIRKINDEERYYKLNAVGEILDDENGIYAARDLTHRFINNRATEMYNVGDTIDAGFVSQKYRTLEVDCAPGDMFEIYGRVEVSDGIAMFGFIDSNRTLLYRLSSNTIDHQNKPIRATAPDGAAKIICNFLMDFADGYVVKIGKYTATPPNVPIKDLTEYRYIMPQWSEVFPITEKSYQKTNDFANFDTMYQLFHALVKENCIEEVNMSTDYLANNDDTIPESYGEITNAGLYMWKVLPPATDGSTFTQKHKRAKVMILGGLHGSEKKSIWNLYFMLKDIHDGVQSRAINILRNFFDIYIVPLACPYGVENNTRANENNVNLNRDFWNLHWSKTPDSGNTYNTQYETRCISWWIEQIKPDIFCDHHTSTGDNSFENGRFLAWGDSYIRQINSLIEETLIDVSPMIRAEYPDYFGNYDFVYGHTQNAESYVDYGTSPHFAYYKGAISCTFEVVLGVKWDDVTVIDSSDTAQTALMSIDYFIWINYLMRFLRESVDILNEKIRI